MIVFDTQIAKPLKWKSLQTVSERLMQIMKLLLSRKLTVTPLFTTTNTKRTLHTLDRLTIHCFVLLWGDITFNSYFNFLFTCRISKS